MSVQPVAPVRAAAVGPILAAQLAQVGTWRMLRERLDGHGDR